MVSKKTQLCIDVLVTLGSAPKGAVVTTQTLAQSLSNSLSHIESIMRVLRESGFVRSVRGPGGGYYMTRPPQQISIWEVVSAVEGLADSPRPWIPQTGLTASLESELHQAMVDVLARKTIGEYTRTDRPWHVQPKSIRFGFGLGPKPVSLMPMAPNSVFELSSFLQGSAARA